MIKSRRILILAAGIFGWPILVTSGAQGATYTFDGGTTTYQYGVEMSWAEEADDFVFPAQVALTGAKFWTQEGFPIRSNGRPFDGHIDYAIYPSINGVPGLVPLSIGVGQAISRQATGLHFDGTLQGYEYSFAFQTQFQAQPNESYFLGLHMLSSYPDPGGEFYWSTADGPIVGAPSYSRAHLGSTWFDNNASLGYRGAGHFAFQVYAVSVPEPTSACLALLAAASCVPVIGWHRRKQAARGAHLPQ